jgi:hypothetical protein
MRWYGGEGGTGRIYSRSRSLSFVLHLPLLSSHDMSSFTPVPLDHFDSVFGSLIGAPLPRPLRLAAADPAYPPELSSVALGGSITGVSDDFFADAINLLSVHVSCPSAS